MKNLALVLFAICSSNLLCAVTTSFDLRAPQAPVSAGQKFDIEARFNVPEGWHIYSADPDKDLTPTKLEFELPAGFALLALEWSKPSKFSFLGMESAGYAGKSGIARAKIAAPPVLDGKPVSIKAKASWLACSDICVPGKSEKELKILTKKSHIEQSDSAEVAISAPAVVKPGVGESLKNSPSTPGNAPGLIAMLVAAFMGGAILNLMPCVFPVIGLKILSFSASARESRKASIVSALAYAAGIVASFIILAALLLFLRNAGENLGWGFQLQNPAFTGLMALLFFAMALSLAGAYEIGAGFAGGGMQNMGEAAESKAQKLVKSALSGVLAVLVASPCTAPFMASALGFAFAAETSAWESFSIFFFLGLGMASPYVLLSLFPSMAKILPKPGAWMEILKQILSIPLFATVIWLVWVYSELSSTSIVALLSAILILSIGLRFYGIYSLPHYARTTRIFAVLVCAFSALFAISIVCLPADSSEAAESGSLEIPPAKSAWSEENLKNLLSAGHPVYVDFTASWCLTCQYNKKILYSAAVRKLFEKHKIEVLTGDWTNKNAQISRELEKFGRAGVPLNLLYPAGAKSEPIILPAVLTRSAIIEAVDKLK